MVPKFTIKPPRVKLPEVFDPARKAVAKAMAACTNAVVANRALLVPGAAVGAVGFPDSVGDASGARPAIAAPIAACTMAVEAICVVLLEPAAVGVVGVPVNPGELIGAKPAVLTLLL